MQEQCTVKVFQAFDEKINNADNKGKGKGLLGIYTTGKTKKRQQEFWNLFFLTRLYKTTKNNRTA